MRTDEITQIKYIPPERIRAAMRQADRAFWAAMGEAFPEVTSRNVRTEDVSGWETGWETGRNWAVCVWLYHNAPPHHPSKHLQLAPADTARHLWEDHDELGPCFVEDDGQDLTLIDPETDVASYLAEHAILSTGNPNLDVALLWHHKAHPEQTSRPSEAGRPEGAQRAARLVIAVDTRQPLARQVVVAHAQRLAEELDRGGDGFCVTVANTEGNELSGWVAHDERLHLGPEDLALLRQGDTIHVPYGGGAGEAVLSGEDDFTDDELAHLAAGGEVVRWTNRGTVRVSADPPVATEEISVADLRRGDRVVSAGPGTFQSHGPGTVEGKAPASTAGEHARWRVSFAEYAAVSWPADRTITIVHRSADSIPGRPSDSELAVPNA